MLRSSGYSVGVELVGEIRRPNSYKKISNQLINECTQSYSVPHFFLIPSRISISIIPF